jgi:hypothetical protein
VLGNFKAAGKSAAYRRAAAVAGLVLFAASSIGFASVAQAGGWGTSISCSGSASVAAGSGSGVAIDGSGIPCVADFGNNRMQRTQVGADTEPGDNGSADSGNGDSGSGDGDNGDNGNGDNGNGDSGSGDNGSGDNGSGDGGNGDGDNGVSGGSYRGDGSYRGGGEAGAPVEITKVKLIPHQGWMYRDGYLNMQVQVTNKGRDIARGIKVFLTSSKKKVKVPRRLKIHQILPGWTVTKTFKVTAGRNARGTVMIEAKAWGRRNRTFLKLIRPWW